MDTVNNWHFVEFFEANGKGKKSGSRIQFVHSGRGELVFKDSKILVKELIEDLQKQVKPYHYARWDRDKGHFYDEYDGWQATLVRITILLPDGKKILFKPEELDRYHWGEPKR